MTQTIHKAQITCQLLIVFAALDDLTIPHIAFSIQCRFNGVRFVSIPIATTTATEAPTTTEVATAVASSAQQHQQQQPQHPKRTQAAASAAALIKQLKQRK